MDFEEKAFRKTDFGERAYGRRKASKTCESGHGSEAILREFSESTWAGSFSGVGENALRRLSLSHTVICTTRRYPPALG